MFRSKCVLVSVILICLTFSSSFNLVGDDAPLISTSPLLVESIDRASRAIILQGERHQYDFYYDENTYFKPNDYLDKIQPNDKIVIIYRKDEDRKVAYQVKLIRAAQE
jgi:hypothetical protein